MRATIILSNLKYTTETRQSAIMKTYQTVNTFSRFPSPAQICSYIVVTLQTCIFYIMIRPSIQSQIANLVLTILFSVTLAILIITTFVCSYIDPSDPVMMEYKTNSKNKTKINISELLYCDYCQSYVTPAARHCRQCDRCVQNFDHHCMWINNCVGSRNYYVFIAMIVSTCSNLTIYLVSVIVLSVEKRWMGFLAFIIVCWVVMFIVGILWILLFNLNLLHFYLMCKGYTTYQFIMARKEQERVKQLEKTQMEAQRRKQRLKTAVQESKKKILDSKAIDQGNTEQPTQQQFTNNMGKQINKTPNKMVRKATDGNGSEEQTNSRINFANKRDSTEKKTISVGDYRQGDIKKVSQIQNQTEQKNNVFLNGSNNEQSMHERSEAESIKIDDIHNQKLDGGIQNINNQNKDEPQRCDSSQQNSSIRISQFFTRNKSFNFIISNQQTQKPHKKMQNLSLHRQQPLKIKQKKSFSKMNKSQTQREPVNKIQAPYMHTKIKLAASSKKKTSQ